MACATRLWHKRPVADLLDEMWTVMRWHIACAVVLGVIYGWSAFLVTLGVGLAWCAVLVVVPARKVPEWTPRK